jgi:hypothetical protein
MLNKAGSRSIAVVGRMGDFVVFGLESFDYPMVFMESRRWNVPRLWFIKFYYREDRYRPVFLLQGID